MFVDNILQDKGSAVVTIGTGATIGDAVTLLATRNIGAVVVVDNNHPVGIVSERDIVRTLSRTPHGLMEQPIEGMMTRNLVTCSRGDSLDSVMSKMTRGRFRHLPVVEGGHLVGLVSIGDVVKRKIDLVEQEAGALREYIAS